MPSLCLDTIQQPKGYAFRVKLFTLHSHTMTATIMDAPITGADWYDNLTDQDRELYDMIEETCPEFEKLDAEECQQFMDELSDLGITTAQQFQDAYYYQSDSWHPEAAFAEYVTTELNCVDIPAFVVIDWQETWERNLSYDFSTIEFDGETYFFHNHF